MALDKNLCAKCNAPLLDGEFYLCTDCEQAKPIRTLASPRLKMLVSEEAILNFDTLDQDPSNYLVSKQFDQIDHFTT